MITRMGGLHHCSPKQDRFFLDIPPSIPHNQTQVYAVRRIKGGQTTG